MKQVDLNSIRKIQMTLLDYFADFCRSNNIRYSLAGGTLLGAVRHKGYIPWDDDIDVMVPRPDYEKLKFCVKENGRFKFILPEFSELPFSYLKLVDTETLLIEKPDTKHIEYSVYIDVFPIDGLPLDCRKTERYFSRLHKREIFFNCFRLAKYNIRYGSPVRKFVWRTVFLASKFINTGRILQKTNKIVQEIKFDNSNFVGNVTCGYGTKEKNRREVFSFNSEIEFEGKKYSCIDGYDEYLTNLYGNYMQLPPKEKQVLSHDYIAYYKNEKMQFQKFFLTDLPAFYKINLFNEINKKQKIYVIFTSSSSATRNKDFYNEKIQFEFEILSGNLFSKLKRVNAVLNQNKNAKLVIDGWNSPLDFYAAFKSKKENNGCIIESSVFESKTRGLKSFAKRLFLRRMSYAFPSGISQKKLIEALGFKGKILIQGGVGLFFVQSQPAYEERHSVKNFIFVGRLVEEKNLSLLIDVFNEFPNFKLNIVGFGELESKLKNMAKNNVHFLGAVDNKALPEIYQQNDVFILPSKIEPWGLVVEEALNNGLPVIVSDRVGCKDDLVTEKTGLIFQSGSKVSLAKSVEKITDIQFYNSLRKNISNLDFKNRMKNQVDVFLSE